MKTSHNTVNRVVKTRRKVNRVVLEQFWQRPLTAPRGSIRVRFFSFRANLSRTSCAGGILRLWALYEHVLWRLLRPCSREGEFARGFEASSALTCRGHLAQEAFCDFGHFTSTCFGVCFGHFFAKLSPREALRLLPRSRVAFFCVRFL